MIYLTGDCHGNFERFNASIFPEQKEMTKDDYVIICGDFGGIWNKDKESNEETMILDWLDCKSYTTLFVDGNHENFDRLCNYPVKDWHGGKVHEIRPSVLHLMRGEVFEIDDRIVFAFGGASSHDISDGILDANDPHWKEKAYENEKNGRYMYRVKGLSWWEEELPTQEEMDNGRRNLARHNNKVDLIITHSPSASATALLGGGFYKQDILTTYLEEIRQTVEYKKHICGHMHVNKAINDKDIILYEQIVAAPSPREIEQYLKRE